MHYVHCTLTTKVAHYMLEFYFKHSLWARITADICGTELVRITWVFAGNYTGCNSGLRPSTSPMASQHAPLNSKPTARSQSAQHMVDRRLLWLLCKSNQRQQQLQEQKLLQRVKRAAQSQPRNPAFAVTPAWLREDFNLTQHSSQSRRPEPMG